MLKNWSSLRPLSKLDDPAECIMKASFLMSEEYNVVNAFLNHAGANFRVQNRKGVETDILCRQINIEKTNYAFISKNCLVRGLRNDLYIGLVIFIDGEKPAKYLIPSKVWEIPNMLFTDSGLIHSEYGINVNRNTFPLLVEYAFETIINNKTEL